MFRWKAGRWVQRRSKAHPELREIPQHRSSLSACLLLNFIHETEGLGGGGGAVLRAIVVVDGIMVDVDLGLARAAARAIDWWAWRGALCSRSNRGSGDACGCRP